MVDRFPSRRHSGYYDVLQRYSNTVLYGMFKIVFMSSATDSSMGKAAKKNQKRAEKRAQQRAQKLKEEGVIDRLKEENVDPMTKLKIQLQEAKANKVSYGIIPNIF